MYCNHCGSEVPDGAGFCPNCGAQTGAAQPQQGQSTAPVQPVQNQQPYQQPVNQYVPPMNWYKFLIYFALFAGAVLNVIGAVNVFSGAYYNTEYGNVAKYVYAVFSGLQVVDITYGVMLIALAVFAIYVRFRLSGYKKDGPKLLLLVYVAGLIIAVLYFIVYLIIVLPKLSGSEVASFIGNCIGRVIGTVIGSVIAIIINKIYFDKRKQLFVN